MKTAASLTTQPTVLMNYNSALDFSPENAKDCNQETLFSQHLLVCALQEMGNLILGLGTTACNLISDQSLSEYKDVSIVTQTLYDNGKRILLFQRFQV